MRAGVVVVGMLLAGCVQPPRVADVSEFYSAEEIAPYDVPGDAAVDGQGFRRQRGGGVVTCAGEDVLLMPDVAYGREIIAALGRGDVVRGAYVEEEHPHAFRRERCDAEGNFTFENLAPGGWIVLSAVNWRVGDEPQGGFISRDFTLGKGRRLRLVVSHRDGL